MKTCDTIVLLSLALLSAACVSDGVSGEDDRIAAEGDAPEVQAIDLDPALRSPPEACEDFYGQLADLAGECDYDRQLTFDYYLAFYPGHVCQSVSELRDARALYRECIPALEELGCDTFSGGQTPAACDLQFTYDPYYTSAPSACRDVANAYAINAANCGYDYEDARDAFLQEVACGNVVEVRNRYSLYTQCIPAILASPCDNLSQGFGDGSCSGQLLSP